MRILHIANGDVGPAAASVAALKQWSQHSHELVAKWATGYTQPQLLEANTTPETVLELANQADVLHFHGIGSRGTLGNPCTIHDIDWQEYRASKRFVFHGNVSMLAPDGSYIMPGGDRFRVSGLDEYDLLLGSYPSCAQAYDAPLMEYVPDILPVNDWLLAPLPGWTIGKKDNAVCTARIRKRCKELQAAGLPISYLDPTMLPSEILRARRNEYAAALDNYSDGHWTPFGLESLAQGVPCAVHVSETDAAAFKILGATPAPFIQLEYGGADLQQKMMSFLTEGEGEQERLAELGRSWIAKFYDPEKLSWLWDTAYTKLG